jgi:hypothetical protein
MRSRRFLRFPLGLQAEPRELFHEDLFDFIAGKTQDEVFFAGGRAGRSAAAVPLDFLEGAGEILQPQLQAVQQLLQGLQGGGLPPGHVAAQHGRRDLGRMGDVLEGPAVPDAEGSQGFGQTIEGAHSLEFTPALSVWQQPACGFPKENC